MRTGIEEQYDAQSDIFVQPGDCRFATGPDSRLISRGIQSCVALAVHIPKHNTAALLRFSWPGSAPASAEHVPVEERAWLSGESAIPALFARLRAMGTTNGDMSVYAVGGAAVSNTPGAGAQNVPSGKSNELAMRRLLWREGVLLKGEDVGGSSARTVWFEAGSGRIIVRTQSCSARPAVHREGAKLWHFAS